VNVLFEMLQESHFTMEKYTGTVGVPAVGPHEAIADDNVMGQEHPSCAPHREQGKGQFEKYRQRPRLRHQNKKAQTIA